MTQYAIVTDLNRCVGCLACMVACKAVNNVPIGSYWNKVLRIGPVKKDGYAKTNDVEMYYLPVQCQHCENPACVSVCPTEASHKLADGTVQVDKEKCIGCQFCAMACPYGVRYLNEEERVVEKCTLCDQITAAGGLPQCVIQCGGRARFFGDLDKGIESFEAPAIGYDVDRSYDNLYTGNRITVGELAKEYSDSDVYKLPNAGNEPSFAYILRDRKWQG
ncbi:4Fe-4S dicluster domain-containing protein [Parvibacter caecicola]|uniref:Fe-S-cluster-containing dehydrogenase component n=4 Tax=Parvibacter caecicola TaxID=747645 RepID=A0A7W5GRC6_9ACTN|nr:4Fe-4S dicluster domain-containing protein [Parvibacter caecicola]MBB3172143.1 Fe-S-cluster-containing dehydrogenase component [Parvibacter caecicola]MCR2041953.1 4Fe-4S dicluster domain-containing protein [Parvibacter caecicola]RNL09789.1 4Fe-4S ferredoxin [Parvibacter caecicola]